jgi:hypothetical protein
MKYPKPDSFVGKFYQIFKELTPIIYKIIHEIQEERILASTKIKQKQ